MSLVILVSQCVSANIKDHREQQNEGKLSKVEHSLHA